MDEIVELIIRFLYKELLRNFFDDKVTALEVAIVFLLIVAISCLAVKLFLHKYNNGKKPIAKSQKFKSQQKPTAKKKRKKA